MKTKKPKFKIGDVVSITGTGYDGEVIAYNPFAYTYLLDCFPGALGNYIWITLKNKEGKDHLYAANWFEESKLRKLGQKELQKRYPKAAH